MPFKIIYEPSGRAKEYADLALNVYRGCSIGCKYCYAPTVLHQDRKAFHENVSMRDRFLEKVERDCQTNQFEGKKVLLCFTCDAYQMSEMRYRLTRSVLELFNKYNINFSILTKSGTAEFDFDLFKPGDSFGMTLTFSCGIDSVKWEPRAAIPVRRLELLEGAKKMGISTWVSMEPVINPRQTLDLIHASHDFVDFYKIGKLNTNNCRNSEYYEELTKIEKSIDWKDFGLRVQELLIAYGKEYYIKDDLRKAME